MLGGTFYHAGTPRAVKVCNAWREATGARPCLGGIIGNPPHVFYGVKRGMLSLFNRVTASGQPWLYVDNGYLPRDPGGARYYSIARGTIRYAGPIDPRAHDWKRLERFDVDLQPWRDRKPGNTGTILIILQSEFWYVRHGTTWAKWLDDICARIRQHDDERAIVTRGKPGEKYRGFGGGNDSLEAQLDAADVVISHSSNVATDAVIRGVPAYCEAYHPISLLGFYDLAQIGNPPRSPSRMEWLATLAGQQWSLEEIARGEFRRALKL